MSSAVTRHLSTGDVVALHAYIRNRLGQEAAPLRNVGALESAIMRARMADHYEGADLTRQAALLAIGISQAQAFMDGNKRTAFITAEVFLDLNGLRIAGDPVELSAPVRSSRRTGRRSGGGDGAFRGVATRDSSPASSATTRPSSRSSRTPSSPARTSSSSASAARRSPASSAPHSACSTSGRRPRRLRDQRRPVRADQPQGRQARRRAGRRTPIAGCTATERYGEKLATPTSPSPTSSARSTRSRSPRAATSPTS
jgi:prophage maintenance system killer protein